MKFKVNGLKKLQREIDKLNRDIPKQVEAELKKIADEILADAVARVHVLSGALKASAFVEKSEGGWTLGFSASYSAFEEFGTGALVEVPVGYEDYAATFRVQNGKIRNGEPHPFLFPAFLAKRDKIVDDLEVGLREFVKGF